MSLFGNKKTEGGLMDVIRCDESNYLIWKWSPTGNRSFKENAIRYGSSLRVKDGEVAVFVYNQGNGTMQDFIEGPFDQTIKTANFPILTSIVGSAFGGSSPFQAEIYFINLSGIVPMQIYIDNITVVDTINPRVGVPVNAMLRLQFNITDYRAFIKLHRLAQFDMENMKADLSATVKRYARSAIAGASQELNIPVPQIERAIDPISTFLMGKMKDEMTQTLGINLVRFDISELTIDRESKMYQTWEEATVGDYAKRVELSRDVEYMRKDLEAKGANFNVHQINLQADVAKTAAESLGQLGSNPGSGMGGGEGGGMNPAAMMTGMMMGGAVGGMMTNMMGGMTQGLNQPQAPPPPPSSVGYHISNDGQQSGPFTIEQFPQLIAQGVISRTTHVWKPGMSGWITAEQEPLLQPMFNNMPPPPPPAL